MALDGGLRGAHDANVETQVTPLPPRGAVFADIRDEGRGLRVSWHPEIGGAVLSIWRDDRCVATARVAAEDVPRLVHVLVDGLVSPVPAQAARSETA